MILKSTEIWQTLVLFKDITVKKIFLKNCIHSFLEFFSLRFFYTISLVTKKNIKCLLLLLSYNIRLIKIIFVYFRLPVTNSWINLVVINVCSVYLPKQMIIFFCLAAYSNSTCRLKRKINSIVNTLRLLLFWLLTIIICF